MMRALLTIAAVLLATSTADARSPLQRDVEGFAIASCLARQSPAYLKQQGEGWAQIIIARGHGSPKPLDALDRVVRVEAVRAAPYVNRDEANPMKGSPMPIGFCAELVDRPAVRAAITRTMAALAPAYRGR